MSKKSKYGSQLELLVEKGLNIQEFFKDGRLFQKQLRTSNGLKKHKSIHTGFSPGNNRWNLI